MHSSVPNFLNPMYIQQLTEESPSFIQNNGSKSFTKLEIHLKFTYTSIQVSPCILRPATYKQDACAPIMIPMDTKHSMICLSKYSHLAPVLHSGQLKSVEMQLLSNKMH